MTEPVIRILREKDLPGVLTLYSEIFEVNISVADFKWQYFENPCLGDGDLLNMVVTDENNDIIGHTAFIPADFMVGENMVRGALSSGSIISRKHSGLFPLLYTKLEKHLKMRGFNFLFAFPNENSYPFFVKLFRYTNPHFQLHQLRRKSLSIQNSEPLFRFDPGMIKNQLVPAFQQWRLESSPHNSYHIAEVGGVTFHYKHFLSDEIDIVAIEADSLCLSSRQLLDFFASFDEVEAVNIYSTSPAFSVFLDSLGFEDKKSRNRFVYKSFEKQHTEPDFFLQMVDSDVF